MRYHWISADGEERSADSLADVVVAVRAGDIGPETLLKIGEDTKWAPAARHPDVSPVLELVSPPARAEPPMPPHQENAQSPIDEISPPQRPLPIDTGGQLRRTTVTIPSAFPVCWKLAILGFVAATAVDVLCYVFTEQLQELGRGRDPVKFWEAIGNIRIGCFVLGGLAYMFAAPAAHEFLIKHGYSNFKVRPWAANVCLFVPLAGLVVPWIFWGDVRRESLRLADHGPFGDGIPPERKTSGAALGLGFIVFLYMAGTGVVNGMMEHAKSVAAIQQAGYILIGLDVLFVGVLWLYFRAINDLWRVGLSQPKMRSAEAIT